MSEYSQSIVFGLGNNYKLCTIKSDSLLVHGSVLIDVSSMTDSLYHYRFAVNSE